MLDKIKDLLGSIRFYIVTLGFITAFLTAIEVEGFTMALLLENIRNWLLAVAAVGTADSIASKIGGDTK